MNIEITEGQYIVSGGAERGEKVLEFREKCCSGFGRGSVDEKDSQGSGLTFESQAFKRRLWCNFNR